MKENSMAINFIDEETIICFNGVQIHISKENSMELAHRILDYFEWYEEKEIPTTSEIIDRFPIYEED